MADLVYGYEVLVHHPIWRLGAEVADVTMGWVILWVKANLVEVADVKIDLTILRVKANS